MKKLKITQPGFETYTGFIGMIEFTNGISVEPVPRSLADRVSAAMPMAEVDENGVEEQAGVAARLVGGATREIPVPVVAPLEKTSQEEIDAENARQAIKVDRFYTQEELENIADRKGIQGVREVAKPWGVKDRSIPKLIAEILRAQGEYKRDEAQRIEIEQAKADNSAYNGDAEIQDFAAKVAAVPIQGEFSFLESGEDVPASDVTDPTE